MSKITKNMTRIIYRSGRKIKHQMPAILSITAIVGVAATAVTAVRATPKALRLLEEAEELKKDKLNKAETIVAAAPCYIPTALIAVSTMACILGAHVLNRKQQASMAAAYAMLDTSYKQFRNKVTELYGAEAVKNVEADIAKDNYKDEYAPEDDKLLFFDSYRKKYFYSTKEKVLTAENAANHWLAIYGSVTLNEFYRLLGLPDVKDGDILGWDACYFVEWKDYSFIELTYEKVTLDDGLECIIISYLDDPINLEAYWDGCY